MSQIVFITESAGRRLAELSAGAQGKALRLSVSTAGCTGLKYELGFFDAPGPNDERVEEHGTTLYVDSLSLVFVAGTTVDWVEEGLERRFDFRNPNEAGRCGCGESFRIN